MDPDFLDAHAVTYGPRPAAKAAVISASGNESTAWLVAVLAFEIVMGVAILASISVFCLLING